MATRPAAHAPPTRIEYVPPRISFPAPELCVAIRICRAPESRAMACGEECIPDCATQEGAPEALPPEGPVTESAIPLAASTQVSRHCDSSFNLLALNSLAVPVYLSVCGSL